jgi:hypothetical protein
LPTPTAVLGRRRELLRLHHVLDGDHPHEPPVPVDDDELLDPVLVEEGLARLL